MSLFPLINRPDDGVIAAAANLPLYRETDWNFQTNEPVWRGGNPVMVTGARAVLGMGVERAAYGALRP